MKNVSRNRLFLCFRPADMDQFVLDSKSGLDSSKTQALAYVSVQKKVGKKHSVSDSDSSLLVDHSPKKPSSRVLKAVLFQTILAKRVRVGKGLCQDRSSGKSLNAKHEKNSVKEVAELDSHESESNAESPSCSNPIPEPRRNLSKSLSEKTSRINPNQENEVKAKKTEGNSSVYLLLLISLAATIFWGKPCGILFTSILLYFLPLRRRQANEGIFGPSAMTSLEKDESNKEYKKRVIIEGILERNSQRNQSQSQSQSQSQRVIRALNL